MRLVYKAFVGCVLVAGLAMAQPAAPAVNKAGNGSATPAGAPGEKEARKKKSVEQLLQQGLDALVRRPGVGRLVPNWPEGGYLDKQEVPRDPWGNPYIYISPGQHSPDYDLKSLGADGLEGGDGYNADIESWRVSR